MKKIYLLIIATLLIFTLTACDEEPTVDENTVYVTVYPMQYLIESIAGDTVDVVRVPGAANHSDSIEWSIKEIIDMKEADIIFYISAGADNYIENSEELLSEGDVELVDMSSHIDYNEVCYTHSHEEDEHAEDTNDNDCEQTALSLDPHFWLDPVRMKEAAIFVKDKLISTFPDNQELYNNNFTILNASLEQLNTDYETMATEATKPVITTVMLFTYWHERYDIEILPITTDAHSSDIVPGDIIDFVNHAIDESQHYILFEKNVNSPAGEAVLQELKNYDPNADALFLHGLGSITQAESEAGMNYLTIMYDNLEVLNESSK